MLSLYTELQAKFLSLGFRLDKTLLYLYLD